MGHGEAVGGEFRVHAGAAEHVVAAEGRLAVAQEVKVKAQGGGRIGKLIGLGDEAEDVLARNGAVTAAVSTDTAIVAQDVIVIAAQVDRFDRRGAGVKGSERGEVGFGELDAA